MDAKYGMHTYATPGKYEVSIQGVINGFAFQDKGDKLLLVEIVQWGCLRLGNSGGYFEGCKNLVVSATDILNLDGTTTLAYMFRDCVLANPPNIGQWDISKVSSLCGTFAFAKAFNQNISGWDTSNVTTLEFTFMGAWAFNQNISGWDTSNVTTLNSTFYHAQAFNQDLTSWDTSKVTNRKYTFDGANAFDERHRPVSPTASQLSDVCTLL